MFKPAVTVRPVTSYTFGNLPTNEGLLRAIIGTGAHVLNISTHSKSLAYITSFTYYFPNAINSSIMLFQWDWCFIKRKKIQEVIYPTI